MTRITQIPGDDRVSGASGAEFHRQLTITPGYEQKRFPREGTQGGLRLIADRWGSHGAVTVHQDVKIEGERRIELDTDRHAEILLFDLK
jgi:hypothetical protein